MRAGVAGSLAGGVRPRHCMQGSWAPWKQIPAKGVGAVATRRRRAWPVTNLQAPSRSHCRAGGEQPAVEPGPPGPAGAAAGRLLLVSIWGC